MIETRLRVRLGECLLERELIKNLAVHSLMMTTWNKTYTYIFDDNGLFYNPLLNIKKEHTYELFLICKERGT